MTDQWDEPEEWRVVAANEAYEVSNRGRVRRAVRSVIGGQAGLPIKGEIARNGYHVVQLWRNNTKRHHSVHRLVAHAFLGPPSPECTDVCHRDDNRANNVVGNLHWQPHRANMSDASTRGRTCRGSARENAILDERRVREIRSLYVSDGMRVAAIARDFGLKPGHVRKVVHGLAWSHVK